MNGVFATSNLRVAAYILTIGAPYPSTRAEENDRSGVVSFTFEDPQGEWQREAKARDLSDAQADKCHVPCAPCSKHKGPYAMTCTERSG